MSKGVGKIMDLPKGERYGAAVVSYNRYKYPPDGGGATSPAPVTAPQFAGPAKGDTSAQMEYLAAQQPK